MFTIQEKEKALRCTGLIVFSLGDRHRRKRPRSVFPTKIMFADIIYKLYIAFVNARNSKSTGSNTISSTIATSHRNIASSLSQPGV